MYSRSIFFLTVYLGASNEGALQEIVPSFSSALLLDMIFLLERLGFWSDLKDLTHSFRVR